MDYTTTTRIGFGGLVHKCCNITKWEQASRLGSVYITLQLHVYIGSITYQLNYGDYPDVGPILRSIISVEVCSQLIV